MMKKILWFINIWDQNGFETAMQHYLEDGY